MRVDDIMNKHVQTCRPDDSLQYAAQLMKDRAREQTRAHREVTEVEVNDTLAAICQPSGHSLPA